MITLLWPLKKSLAKVVQFYGEPWSANPEKIHTGLDIPAAPGEKVFAAATGTITKTGNLGLDYARYAVLEHENKDYCTAYLHIEPSVQIGKKLQIGDLIGCIAKISHPHLHFNVWQGPTNQTLTQRGALPSKENVGKIEPKNDPAFPSNFVDPSSFIYQYIDAEKQKNESQPTITFPIMRELAKGSTGPDVKLLQQILNTDPDTCVSPTGLGSPGNESEFFGDLTEKAVQRFQIKYSIASINDPGFGIVGPKTREKLRQIKLLIHS